MAQAISHPGNGVTSSIRYDRRSWLKAIGGSLLGSATCLAADPIGKPPLEPKALARWRDHYAEELFARALPFWDRHGIDHQRGGFQCALDYDGRQVDSNKFHWYQGRGIWVYSYLHNHFKDRLPGGQHQRTLSIARKAADFWLKHGPDSRGWWPELLSHDGRVLQAFRGDVYSAFTTIEGCQELAFATDDDALRDQSFRWLKQAYGQVTRRNYHDPYAKKPGWRVQGIWIYVLNCCTQMLARWDDKSLRSMADTCVEALLEHHHNPDIGLNNEFLDHDFGRIPEEANRCLVGHCLQGLWHVVKEARRRGDRGIERTCHERIRRHLDIGWDHVHGGLCEWVNVGQFDYEWGPQKLGSQTIPLKMKGEYNYVKSFWALNEVLVATLVAYESTRARWAARYFTMAQDIADRHFSRRAHRQASYRLATDRQFRFVPRSTRQDNYHPLRRMMLNLQALDRLAKS